MLTECFDSSDDAAHNATYHAADRIPTTHLQTAEGATGDTEQDVTDRMPCRPRQGPAAAPKVGRDSIVRNRTDDCQRDRARAAISQHSLVQTLRVRHELLGLPVGANPKTPLPKLEQRSLFCFRHGSAKSQLANDFVIGLLVIRPELFEQPKRFSLKIANLNSSRGCQRSNGTAASIAVIIILVFHDEKLIRKPGIKEVRI